MASLAQLQTWLTEAETARHALMTGARAVSIRDPSGRQVQFSETTKLDVYIAGLQAQIAALSGTAPARTFRLYQSGRGY